MKKYFIHLFISCFFTLIAQSSPFKSYDVVIYPEYYFSGVMAEIEAEIAIDQLPLNLKILTPSNTDSIFYVSGTTENPQVQDLLLSNDLANNFIQKKITETKFRIFIFYEKQSDDFKDQHGIGFKRIHLYDYLPNTTKTVTFSYDNPTQDISINSLQRNVVNNQTDPSSINDAPIRHKLPLWQPLLVLGVVSFVVGGLFYTQTKNEPNPTQS